MEGMASATSQRAAVKDAEKAAAEGSAVTQAADLASARVAARLSGKRVEALSERTETSTTWVNKDGSLTTEVSAGPIRFRDVVGEWRDVDVRLAAAADGSVRSKAHPSGLRLAGKSGTKAASLKAAQAAPATDLVTLGTGENAITLQWRGGLPAPKLDGTRATYENAVPGADVVVEATRTGFEQFVEVKAKPAAGFSYTLPLRTKGLKVTPQADGSVLFTDKKSKKSAVMPAPVMWDATVDKASGEHTNRAKVAMKVVKTKGGVDLVLTPDAKFLADPATKYPVTVDPSTSSLGNLFDTYVQVGETVDWSNDTELDLGNPGTKNADGTFRTARSFITWNTAPVADALISSATLSLWNFHAGNAPECAAQPWEVWTANNASTASRWTNQPAMVTKMATSTETKGNTGCNADGWINANVTNLVQHWSNNKWAYSGMGLRATDEANTKQWKRVNSSNAASNPPKLTVTYNYRPRTGTKQEAGAPFFSYGGAYVVNSTTPTLRDTFVDANGDKVQGAYQIFDSVTDTQVGEVLRSSFVPSGQVASVTVPAGVLTNGKTYKFRTSPYDGTHYNLGWSAWKTFTVDTGAPSAPTGLTSTDYPSNAWVKGAGQAGNFTVTPPTADHNWLEWSLDGTTWTKVTTGGAAGAKTISVTPPKDGTHTLQVRTVDKADNKSEAAEYTFHAGPGGFVQPSEGQRTARRLPLVAEADGSKYDKVSFSWRRSAADAWVTIPAGDVTSGGTPLTAWPAPLAGGKNAALVWNATDTVDPDGTVQIKADFTGPGGTGATQPLGVVVDRNAGGAAARDIGPGSVNLLTGDYTLSATDNNALGLTVERTASSRTPGKGGSLEGQAAIFGKEWTSGVTAEVSGSSYSHVRKVSDTAVAVVGADGTAVHFTANAAKTAWLAEPGAEELTLTGSVTTAFTLTDAEGSSTEFTKPAGGTTWQVSSTKNEGTADSTTSTESETVSVGGKTLARPVRVFAPTSGATVAQCKTAPATKGCRVLEFVYATSTTATGNSTSSEFGDFTGQVKELRIWSTAPGAAAATAKTVSTYRYDLSGKLRQQWNPNLAQATQTQYAYDAAGRVTTLTPGSELPWTFTYGKAGAGSAAGDGMLLKASRSGLKQGTTDVEEGTATTSVVYDVPLTGTGAPYAMGPGNVLAWGQTDAPADAAAVFPGDSVPASHEGSALGSGDYGRATVHYLDSSGREVNTAAPGGGITTTEYDPFGNAVRKLTARNRDVAVGSSAAAATARAELGISELTTAERAELLSTRSVFDGKGVRETDVLGPLRRIELTADLKSGTTVLVAAGNSVTARAWTVNSYDGGRPTDGSAVVKDQLTRVETGAQVREYPGVQGETRTVQTVYDWTRGLPVKSIEDPSGLALTTTFEYDAQGRETKRIAPGAAAGDATTKVSTYWSATGTGTCQGRPEWAGLLCSSGPGGAITGGGANPAQLPVTTTEYDWWGNVSKLTETANGSTRTTTYSVDAAGRPAGVKVTGGVGTAAPESTIEYDPSSGRQTKTVSPTGGTITTAYDKLGRAVSYTDADGGTTTTEYDLLDRPVKKSDSVPSSVTYSYDHAAEPRGLVTTTTDSVAGAFRTEYDADGTVTKERLPGGYTLTQTVDAEAKTLGRTYTRDSDGTLVTSDTVTRSVHGQITADAQNTAQRFEYDAIGRLTSVQDTADGICTTRAYTFDARSNRKSRTSATGASGADCPAPGGTATSYTYDSADRQVDAGYAYDAFGRTTAKPGGVALGYYANDLVRQETFGGKRQTWQVDGTKRIRSWTVESGSGSTWTTLESKTNHYDCACDKPSWTAEDTAGAVTRYVDSEGGGIAATTGKSGDVVLQLSDIHGDVSVQLPLTAGRPPVVLDTDEYGATRAGTPDDARYDWLGTQQRAGDTLSGLMLMGARLYDPATGRFLQNDPVPNGGANAYGYPPDPITMYDLNGKGWWSSTWALWECAWALFEFFAGFSFVGWAMKFYRAYKVIRKAGVRRTYNILRSLRGRSKWSWQRVGGAIGGAVATFMGIKAIRDDCGALF
ncbi:DNRLRE domain-containing protein [Streptomyces bambusae]|uniref:DNRLRE domain-containing protein n=1 Tax=Streptomyces bambusae TaxID=1550616 RepID=UPI001CFD82AA|nr:DNRLRE domain-containing protein [Streptomyces bambusae]MCB5165064.1 DNRLRE domain-containing protein [Streptomyces bambusae]